MRLILPLFLVFVVGIAEAAPKKQKGSSTRETYVLNAEKFVNKLQAATLEIQVSVSQFQSGNIGKKELKKNLQAAKASIEQSWKKDYKEGKIDVPFGNVQGIPFPYSDFHGWIKQSYSLTSGASGQMLKFFDDGNSFHLVGSMGAIEGANQQLDMVAPHLKREARAIEDEK